jgi:molybdopterin molybdotransferase
VKRRFLSFDEARSTILEAARHHVLPTEKIELDETLGRTLREDIVADEPNPRFDNSAMDGFAVRASDVVGASPASPVALSVVETIGAGRVATHSVGPGQAIRIMTGAALPSGANAVVAIERTSAWRGSPEGDPEGVLGRSATEEELGDASRVEIHAAVSPGENVRPAGEDFGVGETLALSGAVVTPGVIAVMAALGHPWAEVSRVPRVAILSTGDELVAPGVELAPGQVRDSNTHMMRALVRSVGAEPGPCWHLLDDAEAVAAAVERVREQSDVILTLGGVSAGDFDPVKQALARLPGVELWRVGMRPGQPQAFGVLDGGKLFFGLPGNPVSSAVVFEMLVRPGLWAMMGRAVLDRPTIQARMLEPLSSKLGRRDFLRVILQPADTSSSAGDGPWWQARLTGSQSSGALSSIHRASGFAVVPEELSSVPADTIVTVIDATQGVARVQPS